MRRSAVATQAYRSANTIPDDAIEREAYVLEDPDRAPDVMLVVTGSKVHLALDAVVALSDDNVATRIVSMPSMERFEDQSDSCRHDVLPPGVPGLTVKAGTTCGWHHLVRDDGAVTGPDRFGLSGPGGRSTKRSASRSTTSSRPRRAS